MDTSCGWNKFWNWTKVGVSTLSDLVTVFKVAKVVEVGGGAAKVITDSGKEIFIPSKDVSSIPGGANTCIAVYDTATSKDSLGKIILNFGKSMVPIWGTMESLNNALDYGYNYGFDTPYYDGY